MLVDELLTHPPFVLPASEKGPRFRDAMRESFAFHTGHSDLFRNFIRAQGFDPERAQSLADLPFLPVALFKELLLVTGPMERIKTIVRSSATASGKPSAVALDELTIRRQQLAIRNILADFLGNERRVFIVFDSPLTPKRDGAHTSSRASAIRGMVPFARSMHFVLDDELRFDPARFAAAVRSVGRDDKLCFFGVTWLCYQTYRDMQDRHAAFVRDALAALPSDRKALHVGGWKKLAELAVGKEEFTRALAECLGTAPGSIIDFYGMVEQLGTVYPDCERGYKHAPLYAEVLIRDFRTLASVGAGQPGFIQLLSPLPQSYPGISLLTEDVGEIVGVDDCPCGRSGTYFVFRERLSQAPLKGCGDTIYESALASR